MSREDDGAWLGDDEIFAFLEKFKIRFPLANGLENPILISHAPPAIQKSSEFIRVMMSTNNNHWVCVRGHNRQLELYESYERFPRKNKR